MARPSLKEEKTEHILQAYETCIARYGVDGATLEKIAEEAGMARPLLRHYVGNSEDLLKEAINRYFQRQQNNIDLLQQVQSPDKMIAMLFPKSVTTTTRIDANDIMIASAFTIASAHYPNIKKAMANWFAQIRAVFYERLTAFYPQANSERLHTVTIGIIGIYFNLYSMQSVYSDPTFTKFSRLSAEKLLSTLT